MSAGSTGRKLRRWAILPGMALLGILPAFAADEIHTVIQQGRRFEVKELTIAVGDVLRFSNEDEFIHQIYVKSDSFNFESAEQPPGQAVEVKFTTAGTFAVQCEIHPKMHLVVTVK